MLLRAVLRCLLGASEQRSFNQRGHQRSRRRDSLDGIKGKFLLSLNDHPEVRRIFAGFKMERVTLKYSIGRSAASREKTRGEVLIQNY